MLKNVGCSDQSTNEFNLTLVFQSFRAVRVRHPDLKEPPSIGVTIVAGENNVCIRISDQGVSKLADHKRSSVHYVLGGGLLSPDIKSPSDLFSFSHTRNATRMQDSRLGALRSVSSSSRGMTGTVDEQVGLWEELEQSKDPEQEAGMGPHPRLGIGLPMSNIFAT